ncbi:MAG: ABC transporter permease [Anaerolineae bacterium]|nr:ABC transporter permease [Anaerolineae bacterium]
MLKRLGFALTYALRNMSRDRQRTAFALFSIAAGVATVVALRMLGLMLTDALTSNVQAFLRADLTVFTSFRGPTISILNNNRNSTTPFSAENRRAIDAWAARNNIAVTYTLTSELMQIAIVNGDKAGRPAFVLGYFIDPAHYPFYDTIRAQDPTGKPLSNLFTGPDQVVVGRRAADQLGIKVGDTLRVGTAQRLHTVTGIVPDTSESNFDNPFSVMFSFIYLDQQYEDQFGVTLGSADKAFLKLPPNVTAGDVARQVVREWPRAETGQSWRTRTAQNVLQNNKVLADLISRFVLLLSLVALVIGGVGIINTMLVSVNRRSTEIAVLKTLGLRGRGVALLFLIEALVWGVMGSLIGLLLGIVLSAVARTMGEQAFNVALPFRLQAEPMIIGMVLGIAITAIFSLLPTLIAGNVRPKLVLQQSVPMTRAGCLPTAISLLILLLGVGALVELISGGRMTLTEFFSPRSPLGALVRLPIPVGFLGTFIIFALLGAVLLVMLLLVWLLGKLPSFRNPNLRLAIRGLTLHRGRTALSLMALIIGMTALSSTLIMSRSITTLLATSLSEPLGGNMIVMPLVPFTDILARSRLDGAPGVTGYRDVRFFPTRLMAINGDRNFRDKIIEPEDAESTLAAEQLNFMIGVITHGNVPRGKLLAGRYLTPEDAGQNRIVIPYQTRLEAIGVTVGSKFTYRVGRAGERTYEVVGIVAPDTRTGFIPVSLGDSAVQAPIDVVDKTLPFDFIVANVEQNNLNDAMALVGAVPGVFVFDISVFDSIISRLFNQMAALPLLVAGLSLFAAAVLIATTVSLATMERRRQIGILKALGVKRQQALNQLLIENGIVGITGGIISILPTLLIIEAVPALTQNLVRLPLPVDLVVIMLGLSVGITLVATLLTAWGASGERPLNALRYE